MNLVDTPNRRQSPIAVLVTVAVVLAFAVGGYHAHDLPGATTGHTHFETHDDAVSGSAACPACTLAHVSAPVPGPEGASPPEIVSAPAAIDPTRAFALAEARHASSRAPPLHG